MTEWADRHPDAAHPFFGRTTELEFYTSKLRPDTESRRRALSEREEQIVKRLFDFGVLQKKQLAMAFEISVDTVNVILKGRVPAKHLGSKP
jgi:FixJ family two-component response regulator